MIELPMKIDMTKLRKLLKSHGFTESKDYTVVDGSALVLNRRPTPEEVVTLEHCARKAISNPYEPPELPRLKLPERERDVPTYTIWFTNGQYEMWTRQDIIKHITERFKEGHADDIADMMIFQMKRNTEEE